MVYISLLLIVLIFAGINYSVKKIQISAYSVNERSSKRRVGITVTSGLLFIWFIYAILIMGLRGDFSADYKSYAIWFRRMNNMSNARFWDFFGIKNIFSAYMETGYAILNRVVGHFTNDHVWLFVICAMIICLPVFGLVKKSKMPWLAVLLWISIGPYFEGFNTMRGAMAASILILSLKYLQERKLLRYVIVVLIATSFHSIAILMLFAYFLPVVKPSKKSAFIIVIIAVFVSTSGELLATRFNNIFHVASDDTLALSLFHRYSSTGASLVVPLLIEIIAFYVFFDEVKRGSIDLNDSYIRMIFNGNLIWVLFEILTIFTGYSTRFAMLFFYYPCIFIPFLIGNRKKNKLLLAFAIVLLAVAWYLTNVLVRFPAYYFAS